MQIIFIYGNTSRFNLSEIFSSGPDLFIIRPSAIWTVAGSLPPTGQRSHRIINYALGSVTVQLPCPSASQHKSRSFVELIENRFCTQLRFRPLCTHVTYSPRFLSRLCRSSLCFLFFSPFPFLPFSFFEPFLLGRHRDLRHQRFTSKQLCACIFDTRRSCIVIWKKL